MIFLSVFQAPGLELLNRTRSVHPIYGHQVDAFDVPGCAPVFDKGCKILGVEKKDFLVERFKPLMSFGRKYDFVVSTLICFNDYTTPDIWLRDEWMYFLKDLYDNQLNDNGIVLLGFNRMLEGDLMLGHQQVHEIFNRFLIERTQSHYKLSKNDIGAMLSEPDKALA
jgi:hypothetical protein